MTAKEEGTFTRRGGGLAALAVGLAALAAGPAVAEAKEDRPNVVLIVADDLAPQWVGFMPDARQRPLTPTLDRLAAEGAPLLEMHSPSPVCTPSRYALLTGTYPSRATNDAFARETAANDGQTAVMFNTHLLPEQDNLARRLRAAGYVTGAVGKNHVVEVEAFRRLPYDAPLDDPATRQQLAANAAAVRDAFHAVGFDVAEHLYHGNPDADGVRALAAHNQDWITDAAVRFLDQHHDGPFFLYMATTIPHGPHAADRSHAADPRITPRGLLAEPPAVQRPRDTIPPRLEAEGATGWNAANVLWLDDAVEAVIAKLTDLGVEDETYVVFVSDHGTDSKGSLYRGGTRTVGLVWRDGGFAVDRVEAPLTLMDVAPTVLDWCGVAYDEADFDGRSMTPVLAGEADAVHEALFFEVGYTRAVQQGGFKYLEVRYPPRAAAMTRNERAEVLARQSAQLAARGRPVPTDDPMAPFSHLFLIPGGADAEQVAIRRQPHYADPEQLYDLSADPTEQVNLAGDPAYAATLAELRARLHAHLATMPGSFGDVAAAP